METQRRLFNNVYVCKKCKSKRKASVHQVLKGNVSCRRCGNKSFRVIKKSKLK